MCEVVRKQEIAAGITKKSWIEGYVIRAIHLCKAISKYLLDQPEAKRPDDFEPQDWHTFGKWLTAHIRAEPISPSTQNKGLLNSNKLLSLLARAEVISARVELDTERSLKRARHGESEFTKTGHNHKPKVVEPLTPFAFRIEEHGRDYDYTEYQPLARCLLLAATKPLEAYYRRYPASGAKSQHNCFVSLLRFLVNLKTKGEYTDFFHQLQSENFTKIPSLQWETIVYQWRESLRADESPRGIKTSHAIVKRLNNLWSYLASAQALPDIALVGFKNAKSRANNKPRASLAQLTPKETIDSAEKAAAWERIKKFFDSTEQAEAHEFIRSICATLTPEVAKTLSIDKLIEHIHGLNTDRLQLFRKCAEADFLKWHKHWQKGQACLAMVKQSSDELIYLLDSPELTVSEKRNNSSALLFSGSEDIRLGTCLQYLLATKNGIATGIHGRYHHIARSFGGRFDLHAYLHPHPHATLALWILLMVDTGANCEVVREIPWDCMKPSSKAGHFTLHLGNKARAGGKAILDEIPDNPPIGHELSLPGAIREYQKMAMTYRVLAVSEAKSRLLLHEHQAIVHGLEEWTARKWFVDFLGRHEPIQGLEARPSTIRPSVLLSVQHQNSNNLSAPQVIADHSASSTTLLHYTGRAPTTLKYNQLIREFSERYQAIVISSIEGAYEKLGLTETEFKRILSDAARTGLGVACLDSLAGVQPGTKPGKPCTRQDSCCTCQMRYVVATVDNISDLILFNEYLHVAQTEQVNTNPEGWEKRWLPWLVFSEIALTKLRQGETAKIFEEASIVASRRRSTNPPLPLS